MKVLVVLPGLNGQGGAEQSFASTAPLLMEYGVELELALLTARRRLVPTVEEMGVRVHDLSSVVGVRSRAGALRELIHDCRTDLVHATLYEAEVPALLAARRTGVPALVTWASTSQTSLSEGGVAAWKLRASDQFQSVLGRYARAKYHAVSHGVAASRGRSLGVSPARITVAERGRDESRFSRRSLADLEAVRDGLGLSSEDRLVLSVARLEPPKGLERLVEMVDELVDSLPDVVVAVAGRDGTAGDQLRSKAANLRHSDRIRFLGHRDDVAELLQIADCWVCTSHREGAAGAMLEAWASGCPVVTVPVEGTRGVAIDGRNAVVCEPAQLSASVRTVLTDHDFAQEISANAFHDFLEKYTIEVSAGQLFHTYLWAAGMD